MLQIREDARMIFQAGLDAVRPEPLVRMALAEPGLAEMLRGARRILVLGAGKASAAMAAAVEDCLADQLDRIEGVVNVPAGFRQKLQMIRLHSARPAGSNQPTLEGVVGADEMLKLAENAHADDVALCLISGGGSALLPAPAPGIRLEEKQTVTQLLHHCGATINEMNAVRKHLSAIKGGQLAERFAGRLLVSLIISDVIGDPLDVIASGPTAPDPTTFQDALDVIDHYNLRTKIPPNILSHLQAGQAGDVRETLKSLPSNVRNIILGNNSKALAAAEAKARELGYSVVNLGAFIEGETRHIAVALAGVVAQHSP